MPQGSGLALKYSYLHMLASGLFSYGECIRIRKVNLHLILRELGREQYLPL